MKKITLPQLKSLRVSRDWTQEQLAEYAGLSVRTIQRLESGEPAAIETAKSLAAALELVDYSALEAASRDQPKASKERPTMSHPNRGKALFADAVPDEDQVLGDGRVVLSASNAEFVNSTRRIATVFGLSVLLSMFIAVAVDPDFHSGLITGGKVLAGVGVVAGVLWATRQMFWLKLIVPPVAIITVMVSLMAGIHTKAIGLSQDARMSQTVNIMQELAAIGKSIELSDDLPSSPLRVTLVDEEHLATFSELKDYLTENETIRTCAGQPVTLDMTSEEMGDLADKMTFDCLN